MDHSRLRISTAAYSAARPLPSTALGSAPFSTYALGRGVEYYDMPAVRAIVHDAAAQRLSFFIAYYGRCKEHSVSDEKVGRRERESANVIHH